MRDVGMTMSPATSNGWVSAQRSPVTTKAVQFDFAGEDFLSDIDAQGLREFIHDSLSVLNKDARANGHEVSSEQDWKNVVLDYKKGDGILEEYLSLMGRRERFDYMAGALGVIDLGEALFDKSLFGVLGHKMSREDQFLAIATHVVGFLATPSEDTIQSYCDLFEISDSLKTTLLESVSARSA
ncbi:hypothetical protein HOH87_05935 [bacterium]|nr:hypothetical protein [bacterium]